MRDLARKGKEMLFRKRNPEDEEIEHVVRELLKTLNAGAESTESEGWVGEESEAFIEDDLSDASVQEFWQGADDPATSKKGKKDQLVERMPETQKEREDERSEETDNFETWEQLNALAQTLTNSPE
jgi:hypothetical protein